MQSLPVSPWRESLKLARATLRNRYESNRNIDVLLRDTADLTDKTLSDLWQAVAMPADAALIAVGGYGRRQLFPYSDIDILILLPETHDNTLQKKAEELIGLCWDVGLEIGHSVRTQIECLEESARDLTVQTALLEARLLSGEARQFASLHQALHAAMDPSAFLEAKLLEQQQRHARFHGVAYNLEPNIKESPGGLRDLQTIGWISQACGLGASWNELGQRGIILPAEVTQLVRAERVLQSLRIDLHYIANRREDRLLFDLQGQMATRMGLTDTASKRASELLMQTYYRAARTVIQLNDILIQNLRAHIYSSLIAEPVVLNERFQSRNNMLLARDLTLFQQQPSAILEAFLLLQRHDELKGLGAKTLRALWHARAQINTAFRRDPANKALFMAILREPKGQTRVLRRMNQYGILGRYIPAFGRVVGQMQHDLFHVYTVDEHILMVVRNLRRFAVAEFAHEYPFCSRLMASLEKPELLYLAGLFHDIGKGRGGDHSQLGKVDALRFARQHGLPDADAQLVSWLVASHLTMSAVAQKQDVYDPEVVAQFASLVGDPQRLAMLYLLTVADIRGTSPKVWNNWKAKLLEDLYQATARMLSTNGQTTRSCIEERQAEAQRQLRFWGLNDTAHRNLWVQLDSVYFMRHDAQEIAWHTRQLYNKVGQPEPVVKTRLSETGDGVQVLIYTPDQTDLFARICSFFERNRYSIADAKIYTTRHGYALDSFYVFIPEHASERYRDLIAFIEYELAECLRAQTPIPPPLTGRLSRQLKHFPLQPEINIRQDDRQNYYVMSIVAGDRPGLLSRITRVLAAHRISIYSAKISTLGERAEDTFLINGTVLHDQKSMVKLESELLAELRAG